MPARQLGYLTAFQTLRPHRAVALEAISASAVAQEPLFWNPRMAQHDGALLTGGAG